MTGVDCVRDGRPRRHTEIKTTMETDGNEESIIPLFLKCRNFFINLTFFSGTSRERKDLEDYNQQTIRPIKASGFYGSPTTWRRRWTATEMDGDKNDDGEEPCGGGRQRWIATAMDEEIFFINTLSTKNGWI